MKRSDMIKEMFGKMEAGQKNRDDRDLPWTPMTRKMFLQPPVHMVPKNERVYRQPEGVRRFSNPIPGQGFNQHVANSRSIPNTERIHTPHIYGRRNFEAPSTISRASGLVQADFDATPSDIAKGGLDKLLSKPIDINVPDSRDVAWIAERARLDSIGQPGVLPLGRNQLTFKKRVTLVDEFVKGISHAQSIKERLVIVKEAIDKGMTKTADGAAKIGLQLALLISQNSVSRTLSARELQNAYDEIARLNISNDWKTEGFPHRFISSAQFKTMKMKTIMFILSAVNKQAKSSTFNAAKPIPRLKVDQKTDDLVSDTSVDVGHLFNRLLVQGKALTDPALVTPAKQSFIDLERIAVVPFLVALRDTQANKGNGELNGFRVEPKPTDSKSPEVVPVGIYNPIWASSQGVTGSKLQNLGVNIRISVGITNKLIPVPSIVAAKVASQAAADAARAALTASLAAAATKRIVDLATAKTEHKQLKAEHKRNQTILAGVISDHAAAIRGKTAKQLKGRRLIKKRKALEAREVNLNVKIATLADKIVKSQKRIDALQAVAATPIAPPLLP